MKRRFARRPKPHAARLTAAIAGLSLGALVFGFSNGASRGVTTSSVAPGTRITGMMRVMDGDTLRMGSIRIRIAGIDAPEYNQTCSTRTGATWSCGSAATREMRRLTIGHTVTCRREDTDSYGRMVAMCDADGRDLGAAMVRAGLALDYEPYAHGRYKGEEAQARSAKAGMWRGSFTPPWEYRHGR